jgi:hypothetical protein
MCDFITVAVPNAKAKYLEEAIPRNMHASRSDNPSIHQCLGDRYRTYIITTNGCSCALFAQPVSRDEAKHDIEKLRRKYENKGWSKAKIDRAIGSPARRLGFAGLRPDLREMLAGVAERAGELAVVVHSYEGDPETERFELHAGPTMSPDGILNGEIPVSEDQIIWVRPKPPAPRHASAP